MWEKSEEILRITNERTCVSHTARRIAHNVNGTRTCGICELNGIFIFFPDSWM